MILREAVKQVQRIFGDDNEIQVDVSDITDWINNAILKIARESEYFQQVSTTAYGTSGLTLPDGFFAEKRVTYNDIALNKTSLLELDDLGANITSNAAPAWFYIWGTTLFLYPVPNDGGLLKVWFTAIPGRITDPDSQLPLPVEFHADVVRMALVNARELDQDYNEAARISNEVTTSMAMIRHDQMNRSKETYPVVRGDY